jgi:hypothetical protein
MSIERLWESIPPRLFSANGKMSGEVPLVNARGFKVGMIVSVSSAALPTPATFKIKRVISNSIWVGAVDKGIENRLDMSAYLLADSAAMWATEQTKTNLSFEDRDYATFEHEPANARRVMAVDELGDPWNIDNPIPVIASVTVDASDPVANVVQNITTPITANTEFTISLPSNTKRWQVRVRDHLAKGRVAFIPGETLTNWWSLERGTIVDSYSMDLPTSSNIYMSVDKASMTMEVFIWIKP